MKQIDFVVACVCTVIDNRRRHSVEIIYAMASSLIYYSALTRQNEFYLLIKNSGIYRNTTLYVLIYYKPARKSMFCNPSLSMLPKAKLKETLTVERQDL